MKNLQIDIKIKLQINDTTLELSKDEAESLYNTLGHALNRHPNYQYPWPTTPLTPYAPYKITTTGGTGEMPYYPSGVRSIGHICTVS